MVVGKDRQTVADIALMAAGDCEYMFTIMRDYGLSATDSVVGIEFANIVPRNSLVTDYFNQNGLSTATYSQETDHIELEE